MQKYEVITKQTPETIRPGFSLIMTITASFLRVGFSMGNSSVICLDNNTEIISPKTLVKFEQLPNFFIYTWYLRTHYIGTRNTPTLYMECDSWSTRAIETYLTQDLRDPNPMFAHGLLISGIFHPF
jgi:hypothetical protein